VLENPVSETEMIVTNADVGNGIFNQPIKSGCSKRPIMEEFQQDKTADNFDNDSLVGNECFSLPKNDPSTSSVIAPSKVNLTQSSDLESLSKQISDIEVLKKR